MNGNPMVVEVNRLIANLLASGGEVFLPGVGSLCTEQRGAKRLSKNTVAPPERAVSFSSQERGSSLVAEIGRAASCDAVAAQDIYDRWLSHTYADEVLNIEGVGTLKFKHFTPDPAFDALLNPQGHAPVRIKRARRFDWVLWVGSVAILVAAGFCAYIFLPERFAADVVPPAAPVIEAVVAAEEPEPEKADALEVVPTPDPVAEQPQEADANVPAELVSGTRYVVLGVFSTPGNAARAASDAVAKDASLSCRIYIFGDKYLVSPFSSVDAAACAAFIRAHVDQFPGLWPYAAR